MSEHLLGEYQGDENPIDGFAVHREWGGVWPRVIARAWAIEQNGAENDDDSDGIWYRDLISGDPARVKECLLESGFICLRTEDGVIEDPEYSSFWLNTVVVIKKLSEGVRISGDKKKIVIPKIDPNTSERPRYTYDASANMRGVNGWSTTQRIQHTVVLTLPPRPRDVNMHATALADYTAKGKIYPFTCSY